MQFPPLSSEITSFVEAITGSPAPDVDLLPPSQLAELLIVLEIELEELQVPEPSAFHSFNDLRTIIARIKNRLVESR
jgi:hypothetical protein